MLFPLPDNTIDLLQRKTVLATGRYPAAGAMQVASLGDRDHHKGREEGFVFCHASLEGGHAP